MLAGLEDLIKIGAFRGRGLELSVLFRSDVVLAIGAAFAAIDDGELVRAVIVVHGGDHA